MPALVKCGPVCAWVEAPLRRLHVNLRNHADLSAALLAAPLLVRCGSLPAAAWRDAPKVCGPQRHELPELLQLKCMPTRPHSATDLQSALTQLLAEMKLHETCSWHPSSHLPFRSGVQTIVLNVLPRHASMTDLAATIERVHEKHELWGGRVRVHAPNTPSLTRCRDCAQLGHATNDCPRYAGVAWRLLFKEPQSYASMLALRDALQASDGYLSHAAGQYVPHRKVTLLFRIDTTDDDQSQQLVLRLTEFTALHGRLLHGAPTHVQTRDRMRECRECNSLERAHVCPFLQQQGSAVGAASQQQRQQQPSRRISASASGAAAPRAAGAGSLPRPGASAAAAPGPSLAAPAAAAAAGPSAQTPMCRSWQRTKTCPRMQKGQRCSHAHPADHVQPHCFAFKDTGSCPRRDACRFPHITAQQLQQPPPAAAPPSLAPPAVPAQADGAAAMDMSDADSAPAPVAPAAAAPAAADARAPLASARAAVASEAHPSSSAAANAAADAAPQRSSSASVPTSNSFAALQDSSAGRAAKQPSVAPSTPRRSQSSAASAVAAPVSSLSALTSPSAHTSTTTSKKRKGGEEKTATPSSKLRRSLAPALSAGADGEPPKQGSSATSL